MEAIEARAASIPAHGERQRAADVEAYSAGLIAVLVPDEADETTAGQLRKIAAIFGDRAYASLCLRRRPNDRLRKQR